MTKVNITTLTPVHIGSGNILQYNTDFIDDEKYFFIIDEKGIFNLIGAEHLSDWILSIEREDNTKEFVKRFAPNSNVKDYSKRRMRSFVNPAMLTKGTTLKEQIHDGRGFPYIPGSSIKGAIRTAVVASLAHQVVDKEKKVVNVRGKYSAKEIEKELFGQMTNDIFRFIHVSDVFFSKDTEEAHLLEMYLNITHQDSLRPKNDNKKQIVETIGKDKEVFGEIRIKNELYDWTKRQLGSLGKLPEGMKTLSGLFQLINHHTANLVDEEIAYWKAIDKVGADVYLEKMTKIRDKIYACHEGRECVLRVGHSIGWRFTTGAWSELLDNFDYIITASRPFDKERYRDYDFPKSRRADKDGDLLGFIKMTIAE